MDVSDESILSTFKNNSTKEKGFRMLMDKYQQRVYWQIRRMVVHHEDTDDIFQNVWIKVWKNLGRFKQQSQLFTWLYRIAVNESLTFLNNKRKKLTTQFDDVNNELSNQLKSDTYFDGDTIQLKLQRAMAELPDKQRAVFNLRYYDELTYEEMSKITGTSVGALKASYHHAVKKIERFIKED